MKTCNILPRGRSGRSAWIAAAALTVGIGASQFAPNSASAQIGYCRTDPIVVLSDNSIISLSVSINDYSADVQSIAYTLNAPRGTTVKTVLYGNGSLAAKETVTVVSTNDPSTYDSTTVVTTGAPNVGVTAATHAFGVGGGVATGYAGQNLIVHVAPHNGD